MTEPTASLMTDTPVAAAPEAPVAAPPPVAPRTGVMGARTLDAGTPQREAIDRAAQAARATGHRFDLLRYLRLRRTRNST